MQLPVLGLSRALFLCVHDSVSYFRRSRFSFSVTQRTTASHERCVWHRTQVFVAGSLANTTFWHRDTQARLTWAQRWEKDGKVGLHFRPQTEFGLCFNTTELALLSSAWSLPSERFLTGAAEGLWGTWAKPGGTGGSPPLRAPTPHSHQQGIGHVSSKGAPEPPPESKLARRGTRESTDLTHGGGWAEVRQGLWSC